MPLVKAVENMTMGLGKGEAVNQGFLDIFRAMANEANIDGSPSKTMILPMYDVNSNLQDGDWAPEIHFVVRKVTDEPEEETQGRGVQDVRGFDPTDETSVQGS